MTAATLHVVPERPPLNGNNHENYSWLLRQRDRARGAFDYARSLPRRLWDWAYRTFHLEAVRDTVTGAWGWVKTQVGNLGRLAGASGLTGLGLLAVATNGGRAVLRETVGRALGWIGAGLGWLHGATDWALRHLGGPGNWLADRLDNVVTFGKSVIAKGLIFYAKNIGPHLAVEGTPMRLAKTAGIWLVALRALAFVSTSMITWPVYAALALYTLNTEPFRSVPGISQASAWMRGEGKTTQAHMKVVDSDLDAAVAAAAESTATGVPVPVPTAPNREARRAQKRAPAHR